MIATPLSIRLPAALILLDRAGHRLLSLRRWLAPACFSLALSFSFVYESFSSPYFGLSWFFLALGVMFAGIDTGKRWVWLSLLGILLSMAIGIPGARLWGSGYWIETLLLWIWTAPNIGYYLAKHKTDLLPWLMPPIAVHGLAVLWQGLVLQQGRVEGITVNANPAGGLLALGAIYLLPTRYWWLGAILGSLMPFTGSRWATVVLISTLALMMALRRLQGFKMAFLLAGLALVSVLAQSQGDNYRISGGPDAAAARVEGHALQRLGLPEMPGLLPNGFQKTDGLHNVPLRMSVEAGVLAAGLWLLVTGYALWRGPRFDTAWWLLLAVAGLSLMDYYSFMGQFSPWWWLLVGLRARAAHG